MTATMIERDQMTDDKPADERELRGIVRAIHDDLDLPEGYRAEIIGGDIVVAAASPFGKHASIIRKIRRAVDTALEPDFDVYENLTLEDPEFDRYIPDLAAWPVSVIDEAENEWIFKAELCAFAAEVTSPRQESRDYAKANGYALGGVPVYLLVDRKQRRCVVFTEPTPDGYATNHLVPFGEHVTLTFDLGDGGPRSATIDTSGF